MSGTFITLTVRLSETAALALPEAARLKGFMHHSGTANVSAYIRAIIHANLKRLNLPTERNTHVVNNKKTVLKATISADEAPD